MATARERAGGAETRTLASSGLPRDLQGLTWREARARAERGLANVDMSQLPANGDVVRRNVLTLFNIILGSLILALFALAVADRDVGHFQDGIFVGVIVAANVAVATFQEIRATNRLRQLRALTVPRATVVRDGEDIPIPAEEVVEGDLLHLKPGEQVVADGHIVADEAEIDDSLLTGESESVRKGPGDALLSGSFCTAGSCYYVAEQVGPRAYAMRLAADVRRQQHSISPLQIRFRRILRVLLAATGVLAALLLISYNVEERGFGDSIKATTATVTSVVPEGLFLGITVAFAVGAVRVSRAKAIVQDINMVEALNYVDIICLDKTGTLTANRLTVDDLHLAPGSDDIEPWLGAFAKATAGESKTAAALADRFGREANAAEPDGAVPFSSERRWSALRLRLGGVSRTFVLGAPETVLSLAQDGDDLRQAYEAASARGLRGVVFAEADRLPQRDEPPGRVRPLALITLADVLRPEVRSAFRMMERLGIEPKFISGDNPQTVASLVKQLGIPARGRPMAGNELEALDDAALAEAVEANTVFGRVTPGQKATIVNALKNNGHFVAMVGDGANDVRALRAADIGVAMQSGTSTARASAGIVLVGDSFEALVKGVQEAQAVLGNTARLSKLFLTKSFYAYLIVIATNMLGLDFPFLPRHGSLTALVTLGIPAVFIAITVPPPDAGRDFIRNTLRFALPASLSLAAAAISVHLITEGLLGRSIEEARTLVSITIGVTGVFYMVEVLGFEGASPRSVARPVLTTALGLALVVGFLATLYLPWLRAFFDFVEMGPGQWALVIPAVVGALIGQYLISRQWPRIIDFLTGQPLQGERLRGRPV